MTTASQYRPDIDGLRALAVLPVLLFHFGFPGWSGGFSGVDVFFVISGYVIAKSISIDIHKGIFSVKSFYFKRVRRIFPALFVTILATTVACYFLLLPPDFADFGKSAAASATFVANVYFWKTSGYFSPEATTRPLLHLWSLAVEEQYYIFAPIGFYLIQRYAAAKWKLLLSIPLFASFSLSVAAVFVAPTANFFLLPTRGWELLAGALLFFADLGAPSNRLKAEFASFAGLLLVVGGYLFLDEASPFPGWTALPPVVGTALVIYAGSGSESELPSVTRAFTQKPIVWIGKISYSLYLVHWPIVALFTYIEMRSPSPFEGGIMLLSSFALATLMWKFVEQPFRHAHPDRTNIGLITGVTAFASLAGVGLFIASASGLPERMPQFVQLKIDGIEDWGGARCFNTNPSAPLSWDQRQCLRSRGQSARILVWGDSFAAHYMPAFLASTEKLDADVFQYTFAGCPPVLSYFSYARPGCSESNARVPALVRRLGIDLVVISARWSDTPSHTLESLPETIARLKSSGTEVLVVGQSPQFVSDIQKIDYLSDQSFNPRGYWNHAVSEKLNADLKRQAVGASFVDPMPSICQVQRCQYKDQGGFLYADYGHFSRYGAQVAARVYLFPAITAALKRVPRVPRGSRGQAANSPMMQVSVDAIIEQPPGSIIHPIGMGKFAAHE